MFAGPLREPKDSESLLGRSVPSSTPRGLEAKMRAAREAATAQATNDMINRAAQMASDLSDPSRSIRGSQAGRFVVHSALPPVGQKPVAPEVVQPRVSVPEHSLSGLDDAAYLEVMEQDILAAQAQILSALAIRGAPDIRSREAAVPELPRTRRAASPNETWPTGAISARRPRSCSCTRY